ncbi:hypothetical protein LTR62_005863 [Meristemomyces frigidus]|uniref:ATPase synthesis protein 25 n=1 Tax=Meristemomyces frigidus TaxID=1508187 RepID=A0AAN7YTE4_9PEZI|nr:hypothetical protein LTR62_005863 [Meristemomyces frigidus]
MALPSTATALRSLACHNCRRWALRSFITSIGGEGPANVQRRTLRTRPAWSSRNRERTQEQEHVLNEINELSTASQRLENAMPNASVVVREDGPTAEGEAVAASISDEMLEESKESEHFATLGQDAPIQAHEQDGDGAPIDALQESETPWYLQTTHQPTLPSQENPMAARQRVPDLPEYPPPLLAPLLQNISLEQGMDDLTLLDLRALDPPPALGSNLIMILGTARSDKHLHVSADRLCRWLRTEHKNITPYADGLLGRNELKLKLKRRAKRTRLMNAVGAQRTAADEDQDLEEGIRTGWVCVNVGRVEGGELPEQMQRKRERENSFVGFGKGEEGCSIVVQLMTEEKREEVGLERLWRGILRAAERERGFVDVGVVEERSDEIESRDGSGAVGVEGPESVKYEPRVVGA